MKSKSAFTIVELLVVMSIITILSAIAVFAYEGSQKDARDSTRQGNSTVISEALEKYYDTNGEYPSVASLVNNGNVSGQDVANKLGISLNDLKMPRMPSGATNPLTSTNPPTNDNITYIASSDVNNASCQNDPASGCDQYTLQYIAESGQTITIQSRHRSRSSDAPTTPEGSAPPSLALSVSPPNVVASATASVACSPQTLTPMYAFSYRSKTGNDADTNWSNWSDADATWSTSTTFTITGTEGSTYEVKAYTRCDNGAAAGISSSASDTQSIIYPIAAPSAPTVSIALSGNTLTGTASAVSCPSGSTAQYSFRQKYNDQSTYSAWSAWSADTTTSQTSVEGNIYYYQAKASCTMTYVSGPESVGASASYTRAISAPAAPVATVSTSGGTSTFSWDSPPCPGVSYAQHRIDSSADWGYDSGWGAASGTLSSYGWDTSSQGYQYTVQVQARCVSSYATGSWSTTSSVSYIRPISTPAAPTAFKGTLQSDYMKFTWSWTAPSCGAGTQTQLSLNAYINGSSNGAWYWMPSGQSGWSGWTSQGNFAPYVDINRDSSQGPIPSGGTTQVQVKYICVNTTTGRSGSWGNIGTSNMYTIP